MSTTPPTELHDGKDGPREVFKLANWIRRQFPLLQQGADIASAATLALGFDGQFFIVTGTTTINGISTTPWRGGSFVILELPAGITVAHNSGSPGIGAAPIIMSTASNLVTTGTTILSLVFDGTNWIGGVAFTGTLPSLSGPAIVWTDSAGTFHVDTHLAIDGALHEMQLDGSAFYTLYPVSGVNYERLRLYANGGQFVLQADKGGIGAKRALVVDFSDLFFSNFTAGILAVQPGTLGKVIADVNLQIDASLHEIQALEAGYFANYNASGVNFERLRLYADGTQHQFVSDKSGTGTRRRLNMDFPTVFMTHLAAGGIVYADVATGELKIAGIGTGISFTGGTLSATGSGGTVTGVSATAPIFITGGASPTPNVTIQGAIVSGSTSTTAQNLGALTTGLLKGTVGAGVNTISTAAAGTDYQAAITWPAATRVLVSTGTTTDPGGDAFFTADTSNHLLAAMNGVAINGVALASNVHLVTGSTNNGNRDRVQFFVGGGTQGATGTGDNTFLEVIPISTAVRVGVTAGIYATERIERAAYTAAAGQTITEAASLYIDNAPSLTGVTGATHALHVGAGNTRLDGGFQFTETSGPTLLTVGAIPDNNPDSTTLVRPSGAATVIGVASHLIKGAPTGRDLIYYDELTAGLITTIIGGNQWLATSGSGLLSAAEIAYPPFIVPNNGQLDVLILTTNTFTAGKLVFTVMQNGSTTAGTVTIDSTSTAGTTVSSSLFNFNGTPATTDRVGVLVSAAGTVPAVSATLRVAVTVRMSAVTF